MKHLTLGCCSVHRSLFFYVILCEVIYLLMAASFIHIRMVQGSVHFTYLYNRPS